MPRSPFADALDTVQATLASLLKPVGFSRHGRSFNRRAEDGLVQVVNLETGRPALGTVPPLPADLGHLARDLSGRFTVNLGIHVREIWDNDNPVPPGAVIQDQHCQIRTRLAELYRLPDAWWSLDRPTHPLALDIGRRMSAMGLPFLDRFGTRAAIIRGWVAFNDEELLLSSRARVDVALLLAARGEPDGAIRLLAEQAKATPLRGHADYVRALARRLGLDELPG